MKGVTAEGANAPHAALHNLEPFSLQRKQKMQIDPNSGELV